MVIIKLIRWLVFCFVYLPLGIIFKFRVSGSKKRERHEIIEYTVYRVLKLIRWLTICSVYILLFSPIFYFLSKILSQEQAQIVSAGIFFIGILVIALIALVSPSFWIFLNGKPKPKTLIQEMPSYYVSFEQELYQIYSNRDDNKLISTLKTRLPSWELSNSIIVTTKELLQLRQNVLNACTKISEGYFNDLLNRLNSASQMIWIYADRIATFRNDKTSMKDPGGKSFLKPANESEKFWANQNLRMLNLRIVLRNTRLLLAETLMSNIYLTNGMERVQISLESLNQATKELNTEWHLG